MSKRLVLSLIMILLVLNLGAGYLLFYSAKAKADSLTSSAGSAANSVTTQNATMFGLNTAKLPKVDVPGEDPAGIARYPKAMRSSYAKTESGVTTVEYKVLAPLNVVLGYYRTQLAKNSWIINTASSELINFSKNNEIMSITGTTSSGVTTYTIVLK